MHNFYVRLAASYVKLQDAYASETGAAGSWKVIGYIAPGAKDASNAKKYSTTVFDYTDEFSPTDTEKETTMVGDIGTTATEGWKATAKTALNDCKIQSYWNIKMKQAGSGASLAYTADITAASGGTKTDCSSLTANFSNIGHE